MGRMNCSAAAGCVGGIGDPFLWPVVDGRSVHETLMKTPSVFRVAGLPARPHSRANCLVSRRTPGASRRRFFDSVVPRVSRELPRFSSLLCLALISATLHAQPARTFDVATIKRAAVSAGREGGNRSRVEHTPTSLSLWNISLPECVQWAYGVQSFQISAPHSDSDPYDIVA